jgi:DNA-binding response OmpR family regulator
MAPRDRSALRPVFVPEPLHVDRVQDVSGLVLHAGARAASFRGVTVDLTPRQVDLLMLLVRHPGRMLSPRELATHAWGETRDPSETVRSAVKVIRARLRTAGLRADALVTVWGVGYRWDGVLVAAPARASALVGR